VEIELDIILERTNTEELTMFCEKAMRGKISDLEWREYQLNGLLGNTQTLKMNGYKEHRHNSTTYVFTERLLLGCMDDDSITTNLNRVTHVVNQILIEDGKAKASIRIINTSQGKIAKVLLEDKINLKVIPRFLPNRRIYRLDI
jgi:hypothetical protein